MKRYLKSPSNDYHRNIAFQHNTPEYGRGLIRTWEVTPGTLGKMALMALFPPAAFVYGPENAALCYIRYNENPTECNEVLVVVDTVLAVLPFAALAKITGGAGPMLGGGAVVLNAAQTQLLKLETAAVAVGAGYIPNVFYARRQGSSDPSGQRSGGGSGDLELALRLKDRGGAIKRLAPNSKDFADLNLDPNDPNFTDKLLKFMEQAKKIHFDLTGVRDINTPNGILRGPAGWNFPGSTNWELRTVWDDLVLRDKTVFYLERKQISPEQVLKLP